MSNYRVIYAFDKDDLRTVVLEADDFNDAMDRAKKFVQVNEGKVEDLVAMSVVDRSVVVDNG